MLPDVEEMVVAFLAGKLQPDVATRVPDPLPSRFVRVWRTGGVAVNRVLERATITVSAWAGEDGETAGTVAAAELAGQARDALLNDYLAMPLVRGVSEMTAPYYDPDPGTGCARYTFTHQLLVRAHFI